MKLIRHAANLRYLTGFTGSQAFLILGKTNYLITDARYLEYAKELAKEKNRIKFKVTDDLMAAIGGAKIIEFEEDYTTITQLKSLKRKLKNKKFVPIAAPIEKLRIIKTQNEIRLLKK